MAQKLKAKGVTTFSVLAFACGTPQVPATEDAFDAFAKSVLGAGAGLGETSRLRRLLFEASTLSVAQVKAQLARDTLDTIRKFPLAEKAERLRLQKARLPGILFEGEHLFCLKENICHRTA